ncbi:A-kinase anchor protein 14-like [Cloeon dipterum]
MKLFIVLALVAVAMGEPAVEKRAAQGIYHFATGPLAAPLAVAPAPIPVATPFAAPAPVHVPVAHPIPFHPPIVRAVPVPVPVAPVVRYSPPVLVKRYTVVRNVLPRLRFVY